MRALRSCYDLIVDLSTANLTFGRYQLLARLSSGGLSETFLASDKRKLEPVIIKRVRPHLIDNPDVVAYFRHESRISLLLRHPHLVRAFDAGCVENHPYIAMRRYEGITLARLLTAAQRKHERLPLRLVRRIALGLMRALVHLHQLRNPNTGTNLGLVHMDIAPHNIIIQRNGHPILLDYGLAYTKDFAYPRRDDFRGRTAYLAPEQLALAIPTTQMDIFSLGVVLHELISGRPLFRRHDDEHTALAILSGSAADLMLLRTDCPTALSQIIQRALMRDPAQRWRTAVEMSAIIHDAIKVIPPGSEAALTSDVQSIVDPLQPRPVSVLHCQVSNAPLAEQSA